MSPPAQPSKNYTIEHDRFLLYCLAQLGYGNWDSIRQEIQRCQQFRFDWYFRTRSSVEIQRHCDTLIRLIEKSQDRASVKGRGKRGRKESDEDDPEMTKEENRKTIKKRRKKTKDEAT